MSATTAMSAPRSAATPKPKLRLTPRGRAVFGTLAVVGVALVVLLLALITGWGATSAAAGPESVDAATASVTVHPGDSLWTIAERIAPDHDPAHVVAELVRINSLDGVVLQPGDRVLVPTSYLTATS